MISSSSRRVCARMTQARATARQEVGIPRDGPSLRIFLRFGSINSFGDSRMQSRRRNQFT